MNEEMMSKALFFCMTIFSFNILNSSAIKQGEEKNAKEVEEIPA